jgi:SAM-dependent methyltransferase
VATADALALPFDESRFDAIVCQFGVMFFADKQAAFREVLRVLKPGGRFLFEVWDRREEIVIQYTASEIVGRALSLDPGSLACSSLSRCGDGSGGPRRCWLYRSQLRDIA